MCGTTGRVRVWCCKSNGFDVDLRHVEFAVSRTLPRVGDGRGPPDVEFDVVTGPRARGMPASRTPFSACALLCAPTFLPPFVYRSSLSAKRVVRMLHVVREGGKEGRLRPFGLVAAAA